MSVRTAIVSSNDACEKFVSGVNRTLSQSRVSKIERFSILVPYLTSLASDVDSWLRFVTENNVDHLTLNFIHMMYGEDYVLPQHLYANLSLKVLELMNCVDAPVGIVGWKSLKRLCLKSVRLSDDVMEGILTGCPVLEISEVRNYCGFNRLEVTSPSLRELFLSSFEHPFDEDDDDADADADADAAYLAISAPNLHLRFNSGIDDTDEDFDKYCELFQELLEKLHHVKELKLANWCIQLFVGDALYGYFVSGEDYFQLPKTPPEGSLLHLKKVNIFGFRRVFRAVELVQFLLKNAKVLENMNIYMQREDFECLSECCVWHWQERVVNEEVNLPASSPHAYSFSHISTCFVDLTLSSTKALSTCGSYGGGRAHGGTSLGVSSSESSMNLLQTLSVGQAMTSGQSSIAVSGTEGLYLSSFAYSFSK
ncbi:hypothetical protein RHGRI_019107 [Rhododendron griersonianum]|uniref:FBD domain-containing protein n=1 Tax=Rhododendron griersonianum TaxID=479676 RepID=A0AAV6JIL3_9ERIC|nr:hypothetical protein RHGRI_019107 [Rhododendron griersonianum]